MVGSDWAGVGGTSEGITARLSNQVDQLERTSEEMVGSLGCCWLVLRFGPDHSLQPAASHENRSGSNRALDLLVGSKGRTRLSVGVTR